MLFITALCLLATLHPYAQDSAIAARVFTLSTCEPAVLTSYSNEPGPSKNTRLEVRSKETSTFRITGVNPLRYKYFVNNQAVTQFMESGALTFSLNPFVDGTYFATAPEIKVPEIFKTDSISTKVKSRRNEFKVKNKVFEDSIAFNNEKMDDRRNSLQEKLRNTNPNKTERYYDSVTYSLAGTDAVHRSYRQRVSMHRKNHNRNLKDYLMFTSGLPLNNPKFGILTLYKKVNWHRDMGDVDSIRHYKQEFANEYLSHIEQFQLIDSIIFILESNRISYNEYTFLINKLKEIIRPYNFAWKQRSNYYNYAWTGNSNYYQYDQEALEENISDLKEQILNKQFQTYEEFVLNVATRVGVLIQNKFRQYSSYNNSLRNLACISEDSAKKIQERRSELVTTFEFIQQTNAELQTLVPYLDINTELYQSVAKKINANYLYLLGYLKNLDFASKENSIQYTLPTHNNLKNIDLIRYTVKREDRDDNTIRNTQEYNYDFWLKGGLKIDFSFGMFATRLTDNVYNKVLLDTAGGIDNIRITRQDDGRASFSFGGMVNVTPRNGARWLNVGGSIGVAYSDNKTLQVLTGLSLHFGKTERLILHAGAGFGTIKYLDISANDFKFNDRTDMGKLVTRDNLQDIKEKDRVYMLQSKDIKFTSFTIPTVNKFVIRPFIGITYNLSGKNVLKAVSGEGSKTFKDNLNGNP